MTFPENQVYCVLDYETYSEADLRAAGAYQYAKHPSTEILCAAWRIGTRAQLREAKSEWWSRKLPSSSEPLVQAILNPKVILVAHNALFEHVITRFVLSRYNRLRANNIARAMTPGRWLCTASLAAALALPRDLEGAANALRLDVKKDMEGRRLMLKWCKPKRPSMKDPSTRHSNPGELKRLIDYCIKDVEVETELFLRAPPLNLTERKLWELDQRINLQGFYVDTPLVERILGLIEEDKIRVGERIKELSEGRLYSAKQTDAFLDFLGENGLVLPNLKSSTVNEAINSGDHSDLVAELLDLRRSSSKSSTAKYKALSVRACPEDGRARDNIMYHGASTGRFSGTGFQLQNIPRGTVKDTAQACDVIRKADLHWLKEFYGNPMDLFSSCIRAMIIPTPGKIFDIADYNAIEARVGFWLADHTVGIKMFTNGIDLYKELAAKIFKKPIEVINPTERFLGKTAILGCQYGMGHVKFRDTCKNGGQEIAEELAELTVNSYREVHYPVVKMWDNMNNAAMAAVYAKGEKKYSTNHVSWFIKGDFLHCRLPSGRLLSYYRPEVHYRETPWGEKRPALFYYGVNNLSKKFEQTSCFGGLLVENVVQAVARDIMAEAMLRIDETGIWDIVLTVHDELVGERLPGKGSNKEFCDLMVTLPAWAEGCPIRVEGFEAERYRK